MFMIIMELFIRKIIFLLHAAGSAAFLMLSSGLRELILVFLHAANTA